MNTITECNEKEREWEIVPGRIYGYRGAYLLATTDGGYTNLSDGVHWKAPISNQNYVEIPCVTIRND